MVFTFISVRTFLFAFRILSVPFGVVGLVVVGNFKWNGRCLV
jgi:hypothetical protein